MNAYFKTARRQRQRGVAAVELALILLMASFILPVVFLFARVFYHHNVLKQATQDAANYMASAPRIELMTPDGMSAVRDRAKKMVRDAVAGSGIRPPNNLTVDIRCNIDEVCDSLETFDDVEVKAVFTMVDGFRIYTRPWLQGGARPYWKFSASSSVTFQH